MDFWGQSPPFPGGIRPASWVFSRWGELQEMLGVIPSYIAKIFTNIIEFYDQLHYWYATWRGVDFSFLGYTLSTGGVCDRQQRIYPRLDGVCPCIFIIFHFYNSKSTNRIAWQTWSWTELCGPKISLWLDWSNLVASFILSSLSI